MPPLHRLLQELAQQALQQPYAPSLLTDTVRALADALGAMAGAVYESTPAGLVARAAVGHPLSDTVLPFTATASLPGFTLTAGAVLAEELAAETRFVLHAEEPPAASAAAVLLPGAEAPRGVLALYADRPAAFSEATLVVMQAVANVLAGAVVRRHAADALLESEARAHAVLDTTVDAIITIDPRGHITSFNRAAERIFLYGAAEVVGRNVAVLMPEPYRSEHDAYLENYHTTGRRKIIGIGREVTGRRKDGSVFPMYLAVSEVPVRDRKLFTGIVRDITERRRLEQEVLRVSEDERRRIGQDLHDGLGQMLTGVGLIATNLARRLERGADTAGGELAAEVAEVAALVKEADQYARSLARGLVPVEMEQGGLTGALERLARNAERLFGIRCTFIHRGPLPNDDTDVAVHLYRIAQEATSNAVRHGKAGTVALRLHAGTSYLRLQIQDDGSGFTDVDLAAPPEALEPLHGMGVRIMHYRARIIGAGLDINGLPGHGTTVTCTLRRSSGAFEEAPIAAAP